MADDNTSPLTSAHPHYSFLLRCWHDQVPGQWCFEMQSIAVEPVEIQRGSASLITLPDFMRRALTKSKSDKKLKYET